jgi:cytochrome c biogenesis protein CcmG/thiol:disulfide interchange protein DsbE
LTIAELLEGNGSDTNDHTTMGNTTKVSLAILLGLLACAFGGCAAEGDTTRKGEGDKSAMVGQAVPDLPLAPLRGGKQLRLSELRGKVVLLDLWASWCAPCKEELPVLDDMASRLRSKGIEIVGVSIDESRADAEQFLRSRPSWSLKLAHDPDGKLPGRLQPPKMPSSYVIDKRGIVRQVNSGFARADARRIESSLIELAGQ